MGLRPQRGGGAVGDDAALLQHVGTVGQIERPRHVILDEQDDRALGLGTPW